MTEQELASKCAHGDSVARKELYVTYGPRIRSLCRRYAGDSEEADDLMQDAFIKIFHTIDRFRYTHPGSLYSWMARVSINLAFDSAKKRQKLSLVWHEVDTLEDTVAADPDYTDAATIPFDVLHEMIEALPEDYRTVFELHEIDELTHKEIAAMLGIKEKYSSVILARARALLARSINKYLLLQECKKKGDML